MVELYFLLYRIPRMMIRVARERNRSALGWTLIGIAVWVGTEFGVMILLRLIYAFVAFFLDWPFRLPIGVGFLTYFLALAAAIISLILVKRYLVSTSPYRDFPAPPPPPLF
jgi:hypothetical protein